MSNKELIEKNRKLQTEVDLLRFHILGLRGQLHEAQRMTFEILQLRVYQPCLECGSRIESLVGQTVRVYAAIDQKKLETFLQEDFT